ncbi:MAG: helix-turn-helix domain-containing protein [Alphaproteobacteria bacterium]|nr:helix-turn-helix domain-containing protein [Alphaproteobacteria bacterium]
MTATAKRANKRTTTEYDTHIGYQIRRLRLLAGMSQEQLGTGLGVSFQQIQKYENGTNRISAGRLYVAARVLGIRVADFYTELEEVKRSRASQDERMTQLTKFVRTRQGARLNLAFLRPENRHIRKQIIDLLQAGLTDA